MLVTADDLVGSIGGSELEYLAIAQARALLTARGPAQEQDLAPTDVHTDTVCASSIRVFYEPFYPANFSIVVVGAGHVGRALIAAMSPLPCDILWLETRPGLLPDTTPANVHTLLAENDLEAQLHSAPAGSYYLLSSHSHQQDFICAAILLEQNNFSFLGMIGSQRKRQQFEAFAATRNLASERIDQDLICPIGLAGISGREPSVIALSVAAQIMQRRQTLEEGNCT